MARISINYPVAGHRPSVSRFTRGSHPITGRDAHGTRLRCECGWETRTNEGPPSATKAEMNGRYRDHIAHRSAEFPKCPHGCGRLSEGGGPEFLICRVCGDEWDPAVFTAEDYA